MDTPHPRIAQAMLRILKDSYDWEQAFEVAQVGSATPWKPELSLAKPSVKDVARIVKAAAGEHDGDNWVGVFELSDGRFASVVSGCDYTGWDCQSGGQIMLAETEAEIIRYGLSDGERERLGLTLTPQNDNTPTATAEDYPPFDPDKLVDRGNGPGED